MLPPPTIPFSSIVLGERGRTEYHGIEALAELIEANGLIQPIVLVPLGMSLGDNPPSDHPEQVWLFGLDAGGRRYHALKHLLSLGLWDGTLHHAATCIRDPLQPGYVLKGEAFATPMERIMTEVAENLGRQDLDWRDECALIVKAYRMSQTEAHARGEKVLMVDFGMMLGVGYAKLQAAENLYDDLIVNPDRYKDCTSIRGAVSKLLKLNEVELTKILAAKSLVSGPTLIKNAPLVSIQAESKPLQEGDPVPPTHIALTNAFINCDSLEYMRSLSGPTFDHIITDPDYAVSVERLNANMSDAGAGVVQKSVTESVGHLYDFIALAAKTIRDQGFLVFWCDLDHWNSLQLCAVDNGFAVQRWPLIWHKTDSMSNAAPAHNFPKNIEYAMVCRKPNAVLAQVQKSSIFQCATSNTTREFNHPFAKPPDVWLWIYRAVTIKGQSVYDPFLGSGSSAVAAIEWGLKPLGSELDPGHYANAIMNLQKVFKKKLGQNVTFS